MIHAFLGFLARHARYVLVAGLVAGVALPSVAVLMRPYIGEMVALLLFMAALRVGHRQALGAISDLRLSLAAVVLLQVALPLLALFAFGWIGFAGALATALLLMMAASPISGSPSLTLLAGHDPAPALRQLVAGTTLLPLTTLPIFWLAPGLGDGSAVLAASLRLLAIIGLAAGLAFVVRAVFLRNPTPRAFAAIDGLSALSLAVVVVGLMSAIGPALTASPMALLVTLAAAFAANFGLQGLTFLALRRSRFADSAVALSIGAGNRNVALFFAALPAAVTDSLLLFIGCYQIPMYLTPLLLGRLYGERRTTHE